VIPYCRFERLQIKASGFARGYLLMTKIFAFFFEPVGQFFSLAALDHSNSKFATSFISFPGSASQKRGDLFRGDYRA